MNLYYITWWYHQYIIILLITVHLIHNKRRTKDKRYRFEYVRKKDCCSRNKHNGFSAELNETLNSNCYDCREWLCQYFSFYEVDSAATDLNIVMFLFKRLWFRRLTAQRPSFHLLPGSSFEQSLCLHGGFRVLFLYWYWPLLAQESRSTTKRRQPVPWGPRWHHARLGRQIEPSRWMQANCGHTTRWSFSMQSHVHHHHAGNSGQMVVIWSHDHCLGLSSDYCLRSTVHLATTLEKGANGDHVVMCPWPVGHIPSSTAVTQPCSAGLI